MEALTPHQIPRGQGWLSINGTDVRHKLDTQRSLANRNTTSEPGYHVPTNNVNEPVRPPYLSAVVLDLWPTR
jgi:hypothetical protein